MPKPRAAKLETATARRRLDVRKKPYWTTISPGIALGYRRNDGSSVLRSPTISNPQARRMS